MEPSSNNEIRRIALIGNANLGKTTLFNSLCGLKQKTGNYPGVTVDKNKGSFKVNEQKYELIDLPGINSLFPKSKDEELVSDYLLDVDSEDYPDVFLFLANALNLKRSLYLADQLRDLNRPMMIAINFAEMAEKRGIFIDAEKLSQEFGVPVFLIDANKMESLEALKLGFTHDEKAVQRNQHFVQEDELAITIHTRINKHSQYASFLHLVNHPSEHEAFLTENNLSAKKLRTNESILRYKVVNAVMDNAVEVDKSKAKDLTTKADKWLLHPVIGYVIFLAILFGIFQAIFLLASYPMDWIDGLFTSLSSTIADALPEGYLNDLLADGIIPGVGGVVIFIPQIAILFILFSILEESGYMQRIVFLMDKFMQRFGMSGKSVVPMISGMACAIPAIMSARAIENKRERLITILVTPLMTCSARIPVYIVLIALIIPDDEFVGIFHLQGLVLMAMYLLGIVMSLVVAVVLRFILKNEYKSYFVIDMPEYLMPKIKNVALSAWTNVKSFVWNAGKIILATSIILFVLATNGGEDFRNAEEIVTKHDGSAQDDIEQQIATFQLETSYLGQLGKGIEPAIQPLGYDWKIGIALISSLAAREVFVGTMSTIYSIDSEEEMTIRDKLASQRTSGGSLAFGFATCVSLLLFYAFALQCLSTVAVTYKETKSIKWTAIQFVYMTALAYFTALIAYQILK